MKPVILDVDTGIDDALALAYAANCPELNLAGVTTCFGNVTLEEATRNTFAVMDMFGLNAPVAAGADKPLIKAKSGYARHVHGENGLGDAELKLSYRAAIEVHAADFIIEQAQKYAGELTLIMVGPLTNLALALRKKPELVSMVRDVVVMGGAVRVPGNITPFAEANFHADPEAAHEVLHSGIPITLVGLDVTMKTLLPEEQLELWKGSHHPAARWFAEATGFYIQAYKSLYSGIRGCALHDPLAVGAAVNAEFVRTIPLHIDVVLEGKEAGQSIEVPHLPPNASVCIDVDHESFEKHFLSRMF